MSAESLIPITTKGRYFWRGDDRFLLRGVVYQIVGVRRDQKERGSDGPETPDPIADERLQELRRDVEHFKELGVNTLYIYTIDASKCHDEAMRLLAAAGIYVVVGLASSKCHIDRSDPYSSYTAELLSGYFRVVDCMATYANTLGVCAADHIIDITPSTVAAEVVRAVVRDVKRYTRLRADKTGKRVLPVGISISQILPILLPCQEYLTAGDHAATIDFYSFANFSWCGKASMQISGWNHLVQAFSNATIPIFFSEYGCNALTPRIFDETIALYSTDMTAVFSGGCVYQFFEDIYNYGLVKEENGTLTKLPDYSHLKQKLHSSQAAPRTDSEWSSGDATGARIRPFPAKSSFWQAQPEIPPSPMDWEELSRRIDDDKWVLIDDLEDVGDTARPDSGISPLANQFVELGLEGSRRAD